MRAVIYARYSSDLQNPRSVDDQIRECRALAKARGWSVADVFADQAISGASMLRPGVQALIAAAAEERFDVVVAEAIDRLSRDLGDMAQLFKLLTARRVGIHTIAEGDVTLLHVGFKGTMNAQFLADLAQKIRRGQRGNIAKGLAAGGLTYGYDVVREIGADGELMRGRRRIREDQAAVVRRIFADYVAGMTPLQIARALNAEGIPAHRGGKWRPASIGGHRQRKQGILHNELYVGVLIGGRTSKVKDPATGKEINRLNPEKGWQRVSVPDLRILDDSTWEAAQALKLRNGGGPAPGKGRKRAPHLLSQLVHCGACGARYVDRDAARLTCSSFYFDGECTNSRRVRRAWLEARVLEEIGRLLARPEAVSAYSKELHTKAAAAGAARRTQARAAVKELGDVKAKIGRLVASIADGESAAPASIVAALGDLERRQRELEAAVVAAGVDDQVVTLQPNAHEVYARRIRDLSASISRGTPAQQARARTLLRGLVDRIEIIPTTAAGGRPSFDWKLIGKLAAFLDLATPERAVNGAAPGWGKMVVRVEGLSDIPPPSFELRFSA